MKQGNASPAAPALDTGGRFRIVRTLGQGGFGTVYLADQDEPVRRRVALKVVKKGMHSQSVAARFAVESQTLALLHHPNIAAVYEAGRFPSGLPYLAMEWVEGVSLTEYCSRHQLGLPERLSLFKSLGRAVQHAHQKGVIHRDLKPSNVLVATRAGGDPVLKVVDFGIAATPMFDEGEGPSSDPASDDGDEDSANAPDGPAKSGGDHRAVDVEESIPEEMGWPLGTPEYMSPEQAGGDFDVDTRADVYSLGIILFELITETTPITHEEAGTRSGGDLIAAIRLGEVPRPSHRLTQLDRDPTKETSAGVTTWRRSVIRQVRGEIDWMVMKATDKDRSRRYDSVSAFLADLERFLRSEPVSAGPPTRFYVTRKFVSRHRLAVGAAACAVGLLMAGTVVGTLAYRTTQNARAQEREALVQLEQKRQSRADLLELSEEVATSLVTDLFPALQERGRGHLMAPLIGRLSVYGEDRWSEPRHAGKRFDVGWARIQRLREQGLEETALKEVERLEEPDRSSPRIGRLAWMRGQLEEVMGRRAEALRSYERAVESAEQTGGSKAWIIHALARAALLSEDPGPALAEGDRRLAQLLKSGASGRWEAWAAWQRTEAILGARGRLLGSGTGEGVGRSDGVAGLEKVCERLRHLSNENPHQVTLRVALAETLAVQGDLLEAHAMVFYDIEAAAENRARAVAIHAELMDLNPGHVLWRRRRGELMQGLARSLREAGQMGAALRTLDEAAVCCAEPGSPLSRSLLGDQIVLWVHQENERAARAGLTQLRAASAPGLGPNEVARLRVLEGEVEWAFGEPDRALASFEEGWEMIGGEERARIGRRLAEAFEELGRLGEAASWRRNEVAVREALIDPGLRAQKDLAASREALARLLSPAKPAEAFTEREADDTPRMKHFARARQVSREASRLTASSRLAEAEAGLRQGDALFESLLAPAGAVPPAIRDEYADHARRWAVWHRVSDRPAEGLRWNEKAIQRRKRLVDEPDGEPYRVHLARDILEYGLSHAGAGNLEEAENQLRHLLDGLRDGLPSSDRTREGRLLEEMGHASYHLAGIRARRDDPAGAESLFLRSLEIRRELLSRRPRKDEAIDQFNQSRDAVAQIHWRRGRLTEAARSWRDVIDLQERLVRHYDGLERGIHRARFYVRLIRACHRLAGLEVSRGRWEEALECLNRGRPWVERLGKRWPEHRERLEVLAEDRHLLGRIREGEGKLEEALAAYAEALREAASGAGVDALIAGVQLSQARVHGKMGNATAAHAAIHSVRSASEEAMTQERRSAGIRLIEAELAAHRGDVQEALRLAGSAEKTLSATPAVELPYTDGEELTRIHFLQARLEWEFGKTRAARSLLERIERFWEEQVDRDPAHRTARRGLSEALAVHLLVLEEDLHLAANAALLESHARRCQQLALLERDWGDPSRAVGLCERGLRIQRRHGDGDARAPAELHLKKLRETLLALTGPHLAEVRE